MAAANEMGMGMGMGLNGRVPTTGLVSDNDFISGHKMTPSQHTPNPNPTNQHEFIKTQNTK